MAYQRPDFGDIPQIAVSRPLGASMDVTMSQMAHPSNEFPPPPWSASMAFGPWVTVILWNPHLSPAQLGDGMRGMLRWGITAPYFPGDTFLAPDESRAFGLGTYYGNINAFVAGWITGSATPEASLGDHPTFTVNEDGGVTNGTLNPLVMEFVIPDPSFDPAPPPPDVPFPCPPSPWPYSDPGIGASPGPTGVVRFDRWK
jgi:hypothetical protein